MKPLQKLLFRLKFSEFNKKNKPDNINSPPYYDFAAQHPLLDDNGDKKGTNDLSSYHNDDNGDGKLASEITIGVSPLTGNNPRNIEIKKVSDTIFLSYAENTTDKLFMEVYNPEKVLTRWIEIKPPDCEMPEYDSDNIISGQIEMQLTRILTANKTFDIKDDVFTSPGTYQIFYFAKELHSKNVSQMKESRVYKASKYNNAPNNFSLLSPIDNITITIDGIVSTCSNFSNASCYTMMKWEEPTEPDNDFFTYTLFIKKDNKDFSNPDDLLKYERLTENYWPIHLPADWDWDGATVYWKVQCIDFYGAVSESNVFSFIIDNANNTDTGGLILVVSDNYNNMINKVNFKIFDEKGKLCDDNHETDENGEYERNISQGNYIIEIYKDDINQTKQFTIKNKEITIVKIYLDIKSEIKPDLYILLLELKLLTGMDIDENDIEGFNLITNKDHLKNAIYIVNSIAQGDQ